MDKVVLQSATTQALQQFLAIWRQDPAAQYNLEICPQNVFLWNPENPIDTVNIITRETSITGPIQTPPSIENLIEESQVTSELNNDAVTDNESKSYREVEEELMKTLEPQTRNHPNPFINDTWDNQLLKILKQLDNRGRGRTRSKQIKMLETYLYLGILIDKQPEKQTQIRTKIQASQGNRKTIDIWKGAQHIQKIFSIRSKELIYQTKHLTVTHIVKLKDKDYQTLIKNLQSKFS